NLMADGRLKPLVVVMPYGYAYLPTSPQASGPDAMKRQRSGFNRDVIEELIPYVESNFRVIADRDHRAVAGCRWAEDKRWASAWFARMCSAAWPASAQRSAP